MIAGIGKGCNFIASDIPALLKHVREIYLIENNETVVLTKDHITIYNQNREEVKRDVFHVTWDAASAEKEGYEHFMLKEIYDQPKAIEETLNRRLLTTDTLDGINLTREDIENFGKGIYRCLRHRLPCRIDRKICHRKICSNTCGSGCVLGVSIPGTFRG